MKVQYVKVYDVEIPEVGTKEYEFLLGHYDDDTPITLEILLDEVTNAFDGDQPFPYTRTSVTTLWKVVESNV